MCMCILAFFNWPNLRHSSGSTAADCKIGLDLIKADGRGKLVQRNLSFSFFFIKNRPHTDSLEIKHRDSEHCMSCPLILPNNHRHPVMLILFSLCKFGYFFRRQQQMVKSHYSQRYCIIATDFSPNDLHCLH